MLQIGDVIELIIDVPERNLRTGMQGTVVHLHPDDAYEVEFTNQDGETLEMLALYPSQFIVVWRVDTHEWVPVAEQAASLIANLPDDAAREVLDFARFLKAGRPRRNEEQAA